jgi:hypothetical protein
LQEQKMPTTTLDPGQSQLFRDFQGGSDLIVTNNSGSSGEYTLSNDDGAAAESHAIAPGASDPFEVDDGQQATVMNIGAVTLDVKFAE